MITEKCVNTAYSNLVQIYSIVFVNVYLGYYIIILLDTADKARHAYLGKTTAIQSDTTSENYNIGQNKQ